MIEAGADPKSHDEFGATPLHIAVAGNADPIDIWVLIKGGADTNVCWKPEVKMTDPLSVAARKLALKRMGYYRKELALTPLHLAAIRKADENLDPSLIRELIRAGADLNARTKDGKNQGASAPVWAKGGATPLHLAAANSSPRVVFALMKAGANLNARDKSGRLPVDYAKDNEALRGTSVYWLLNKIYSSLKETRFK